MIDVVVRAERFAALGDPGRLAIVDELTRSDRAPLELQHLLGMPSNLLAHHLDVLERVGLVSRHRSSGDRRRRYVRLEPGALEQLTPTPSRKPERALFVCTANSARSQLAAALWRERTGERAESAGTHPATTVHPGAVAAARRARVDLRGGSPRHLDDVEDVPSLVVTVCDRAHEELGAPMTWLHWSIPDPVAASTARAFDAAVHELEQRITALVRPVAS